MNYPTGSDLREQLTAHWDNTAIQEAELVLRRNGTTWEALAHQFRRLHAGHPATRGVEEDEVAVLLFGTYALTALGITNTTAHQTS